MEKYLEFLKEHLGEVEQTWSTDASGNELPFQVLKFKGGPAPGTVTYSTLGLSIHKYKSPNAKKLMGQELIISIYEDNNDHNIPAILQQLAMTFIKSEEPLGRGRIIGPHGNIFKDSDKQALLPAYPFYFPRSFYAYYVDDQNYIVQTWLIPVTAKEADYVDIQGWYSFENRIIEQNPDLFDLYRKPIID